MRRIFRKTDRFGNEIRERAMNVIESIPRRKRSSFLRKSISFVVLPLVIVTTFALGGLIENGTLGAFSDLDFNTFESEDFSFEYANNYEVQKNGEVYYLRNLSNGVVAFQMFPEKSEFDFESGDYKCKSGFCYSSETPSRVVNNVNIGSKEQSNTLLSRSEALQMVLEMKYPKDDFGQYAGDCFADVKSSDEDSGYICYAKQNGIVVGIGDSFYPDSSVNLWGLLKMLFLINEVEDYDFDLDKMDEDVFEMMTVYHHGYEVVAKSYYEGLFENVHGQEIWPNRHVYLEEAEDIMNRFVDWQNGRKFKLYTTNNKYSLKSKLMRKHPHRDLEFEQVDDGTVKHSKGREVELIDGDEGLQVYYLEDGGYWEYIYTFKDLNLDEVQSLTLEIDDKDFEADINIILVGGEKKLYTLKVNGDDFAYVKKNNVGGLDDKNLLPNNVDRPESLVPRVRISMEQPDFESIYKDRTISKRYPALMEIWYPDGDKKVYSILIKTRGNATRGYIKSSYTIEGFDEFDENQSYEGDEFLAESDEFKLRSFINDETMIREKLYYDAFREMGYPEPEFFVATVDINGVEMGVYQVTEPIKSEFFKRRGINEGGYYYGRNVTSPYQANLTIQNDEETTLTHYDIKGEGKKKKLLEFIDRLTSNDPSLMSEIDKQNIFDYALLIYLTNGYDSISHNYYLYLDEGDDKWRLFFWDADYQFEYMPEFSKSEFLEFARRGPESSLNYNNLVRYVFTDMSDAEYEQLYDDFMSRWNSRVDMISDIDYYVAKYGRLFEYDNALWNGRHLERKVKFVDSIAEILELRNEIEEHLVF